MCVFVSVWLLIEPIESHKSDRFQCASEPMKVWWDNIAHAGACCPPISTPEALAPIAVASGSISTNLPVMALLSGEELEHVLQAGNEHLQNRDSEVEMFHRGHHQYFAA